MGLNDNQVMVLVVGLGAVAIFMMIGRDSEDAELGPHDLPGYPKDIEMSEPEKKGGKEAGLFLQRQALVTEMQSYYNDIIIPYGLRYQRTFDMVNPGMEGPMRPDLRKDIETFGYEF